jgi:hypothetical protein
MSELMKHPTPWVIEEMPNRCEVWDSNGGLVTGDMAVDNVVCAINTLAADNARMREVLGNRIDLIRKLANWGYMEGCICTTCEMQRFANELLEVLDAARSAVKEVADGKQK